MEEAKSVIRVGQSAVHDFVIRMEDMELFRNLSNDSSLIHTSIDYARTKGYKDVIVYGGLMLAQVSRMVGQHLPGACGVSLKWTINYRSALYIGEAARIFFEVSSVSRAAGMVECKYRINAADRLIAQGQTQSMVPLDMIDDGFPIV